MSWNKLVSKRLKNHFFKGILLTFITILLISSCQSRANKPNTDDSKNDANHIVKDSLDFKIGQMLMIGFRGLSISESEHIKKDIQEHHLGGVVLYSVDLPSDRTQLRNIESPTQLKQLNEDLQKLSNHTLLIGIDQEGGRVSRLSPKYGFPQKIPSAQYLGQLNDLDSTAYYSEQTARLLKEYGVNFNFAPDVDVNVNPDCPVIGGLERSFSANPSEVIAHAKAVIAAHKQHNIICSLKHFPGHGSAKMDSHKGFTDVTDSWLEKELEPYEQLIEEQIVDAVMTAHVFNRKLDENYPATLSRKINYDLLRQKMGYNGFIISDDMHMGAIEKNFELEEAIERAINSGVDMLIFSNNSPDFYDNEIASKAVSIIKKLIEQGKISEERIEASFKRIVELKGKL